MWYVRPDPESHVADISRPGQCLGQVFYLPELVIDGAFPDIGFGQTNHFQSGLGHIDAQVMASAKRLN
jgi:hypothetical protein